MIIKPRIRGFICTTAHPIGCAAHVQEQIGGTSPLETAPRKVLVVGSSGGYGLASRVVTAFGGGAGTLGVSFEKAPTERKTGGTTTVHLKMPLTRGDCTRGRLMATRLPMR